MVGLARSARPGPRLDARTALAVVFAPAVIYGAAGALTLAMVLTAVVREGDVLLASVYAVGVALPVSLGLSRLAQERDQRFARLMIGAGVLWALTALAQSSDPVLYSFGRVTAWAVEPVIVYLLLAFPRGRLTTLAQRRLVAAAALTAGVLYIPTALVAPFPEPSPWATCGTDCPANAFAVADWAAVGVVGDIRQVLTVVLFAAVAVSLVRRSRRATPMLGSVLAPVAWIAAVQAVVTVLYLATREDSGLASFTAAVGWSYLLSLPAVALALAVSGLRQRLFAAGAIEQLARSLAPGRGVADLRGSLATALGDPSLAILYWSGGGQGGWVDEAGRPTAPPHGASHGRAFTVIAADEQCIAAIEHDAELSRDPELIHAAVSLALTTLENDRLTRELRMSVHDLNNSRARIVSAADAERRRIERDLHDGAQQRLVALRIQLALVAEDLAQTSAGESSRLHELEHDVDSTIDELRSFARGIYPPLLAERGLAEALQAAARNSPIATDVSVPHLCRYPRSIELAVYFACVEALQNVAKHAHGATRASVSVAENGELRFEVHDNGAGFSVGDVPAGAGLANIADRLAAVGGVFDVTSSPEDGTTITGTIPTR